MSTMYIIEILLGISLTIVTSVLLTNFLKFYRINLPNIKTIRCFLYRIFVIFTTFFIQWIMLYLNSMMYLNTIFDKFTDQKNASALLSFVTLSFLAVLGSLFIALSLCYIFNSIVIKSFELIYAKIKKKNVSEMSIILGKKYKRKIIMPEDDTYYTVKEKELKERFVLSSINKYNTN